MDSQNRVNRINAERIQQALTFQQLADMSQLSQSTVHRTLTGKTIPEESTISAMESALGITDSPTGEPIDEIMKSDPILERYLNTQETRIIRMRSHYNMLLAEKNRWIMMLFVLCLIFVSFICVMLIFDVLHPNIGWIRQQLGLGADWFHDTIDLIKECF